MHDAWYESNDWQGRRVTIMGLGNFGGGLAAAHFAHQCGADVTVTDQADASRLARPLAMLRQFSPSARIHLDGHTESEFTDTDLLIVNPAVRPDNRYLQLARSAGVPVTSEIELVLNRCPAPIIGVTGTNGKSTTTAMITWLLEKASDQPDTAPRRRVWCGGNIGNSLLNSIEAIAPADHVVLELSSFQLHHLSPSARLPEIVVLTGCTPNHLNWHGTWEHYLQSKRRIIRHTASHNDACSPCTSFAAGAQILIAADCSDPVLCNGMHNTHTVARAAIHRIELIRNESIPELKVPGVHNRLNARCAATASLVAIASRERIRQIGDLGFSFHPDMYSSTPVQEFTSRLAGFAGLDCRLSKITELRGISIYDDSAATTPESVIAAIASFGRVWVIAGGISKGIDLSHLAAVIAGHAKGCALFGSIREELYDAIGIHESACPVKTTEHLADAFAWCYRNAESGDVIILSPGFASYDQYLNFEDRSRSFRQLVSKY